MGKRLGVSVGSRPLQALGWLLGGNHESGSGSDRPQDAGRKTQAAGIDAGTRDRSKAPKYGSGSANLGMELNSVHYQLTAGILAYHSPGPPRSDDS